MSFKILVRTSDGMSSDGDPEFADTYDEAFDLVRDRLKVIDPGQKLEVTSNGSRLLVLVCEVSNNQTA